MKCSPPMFLTRKYHAFPAMWSSAFIGWLQVGAPEVITVKCDVGVEAECEEAVSETVVVMGSLDILVNNAGYLARENFIAVTSEAIDKSMAVNLKSAVKLSQASLPHLQRSRRAVKDVKAK
mgnify:CR=1 FL=1